MDAPDNWNLRDDWKERASRSFYGDILKESVDSTAFLTACTLLKEKEMLDVAGVRGKIEQWLWCGIFGELYGGANETRFVQDVVGVMKWVDGDVNLPKTISDAYFSPNVFPLKIAVN